MVSLGKSPDLSTAYIQDPNRLVRSLCIALRPVAHSERNAQLASKLLQPGAEPVSRVFLHVAHENRSPTACSPSGNARCIAVQGQAQCRSRLVQIADTRAKNQFFTLNQANGDIVAVKRLTNEPHNLPHELIDIQLVPMSWLTLLANQSCSARLWAS